MKRKRFVPVDLGDGEIFELPIATAAEAERADICICKRADEPTPFFATNHFGKCHDCGVGIQFRPTAPTKPRKVCVACALQRAEGGRA